MSYLKDLDEYTQDELMNELRRRYDLQKDGLCDYCERPQGVEPFCRFPDRHRKELPVVVVRNVTGLTGPGDVDDYLTMLLSEFTKGS